MSDREVIVGVCAIVGVALALVTVGLLLAGIWFDLRFAASAIIPAVPAFLALRFAWKIA